MAFSDYVVPTVELTLPNGATATVRGIALQDITVLLSRHLPTITAFFNRMSSVRDGVVRPDQVAAISMDLLGSAPALAADIIALAADEPNMGPKIQRYPIGVQVDALEKICTLTLEQAGGAKNLGETVMRVVKGISLTLESASPSTNGLTASAGK